MKKRANPGRLDVTRESYNGVVTTIDTGPRSDNRGILFAERMRRAVDFRRVAVAPPLTPVVEHCWLADWDLTEPIEQKVVAHPCVNLVWQNDDRPRAHGPSRTLTRRPLSGRCRVLGVQFRPGGFAGVAPGHTLVDTSISAAELFGGDDLAAATSVIDSEASDEDRVAAVQELLERAMPSAVDDAVARTMALAHRCRTDRSILRVDDLATAGRVSARTAQRLFATHIGLSPKWVIRRYRAIEAIEHADGAVNWSALAARLGYADQAHLIREFGAATGFSPTGYVARLDETASFTRDR